MRQGFSVQTNDYEALAVTTIFVESFGYYILSNINNQDLINALLREQVFILSIYITVKSVTVPVTMNN
ncbi:hypothetical protein QLX08_004381 [Tetragonisca angustula]|uniref:Uncharacterized protein n=1 Tax=Tetragonisca angustula TaxID=166442 RepID=A0AAW1A2T7_9HYME